MRQGKRVKKGEEGKGLGLELGLGNEEIEWERGGNEMGERKR